MPAVTVRSGRGRRSINEINMVPFIDVMLVLLIIFMVTAPLITTGVVDLPSVGKGQRRPDHVVEANLSFLATVGSVSPYVGLFGTVWGIMHAFVGLANLTQVSLATVAPGIAEALVATAIGLFAAIPAVIAYNRFARDIDRIATQLDTFIEEFSNILQRNASVPAAAGAPGR